MMEATSRLNAAKQYLASYNSTAQIPDLESAILQVRKSLETIAYSAIAPDKKKYAAFRSKVEKDPDYTKDYHASNIFSALAQINKEYYPVPLIPFVVKPDETKHFDRKEKGFLKEKQFKRIYDRLGKHLHAHNPWSNNKNIQNFAKNLPKIIEETQELLDLHVRFIRTPTVHGAWVVEVDRHGKQPPRIITAIADGNFVVAN